MNAVSRWANRHARLAIALLIGCELINGFGGMLLGANMLSDMPQPLVLAVTLAVVGGAIWLHIPKRALLGRRPYAVQRWRLTGAFGSNWLLFVLLGAYWGHTVQTPSTGGAAWGSRRVMVRSDTLIKPAGARQKPVVVRDEEGYISSRSGSSGDTALIDRQRGKRLAYFSLFLLGLTLTFVSATLSCSIACSGYGALAALTFALGLGFMAGGVYFLGRATERPVVPLREQPLPQRRRTLRRFWLSWLILIGIFGLSLLTCSR